MHVTPIRNHRRIASLLIAMLVLTGCRGSESFLPSDGEVLHDWLDVRRTTPSEMIQGYLREGRPVFLIQSHPLSADPVELMRYLVPVLEDAGHPSLGLWFVNAGSQKSLDDYLRGAIPDPRGAEALLRGADPSFGYAEYRDFLDYVRNLNTQREPDAPRFRLVALNGEEGPAAGALSLAAYPEGNPGVVWIPGAWSGMAEDVSALGDRIASAANGNDAAESDPADEPPTPPKPALIGIHGPLRENNGRLVLPHGGLIETIGFERDIRDRAYGFTLDEAPFSRWPAVTGEYDGVIVIGLPYVSVTPIENFIRREDLPEAFVGFPGQFIKKPIRWAAGRMNAKIRRAALRWEKELRRTDIPGEE